MIDKESEQRWRELCSVAVAGEWGKKGRERRAEEKRRQVVGMEREGGSK